ncbi:MAG: ATP-dependent metallopeptidase FtsH/Yme1/Tma family protein [Candidatus Atribacteria bacterium]|nr:MAG: ATP-dependent metallopeptidase FtsH/Yme1/Tma family protein [Candidatus Atribacteria bacterium]
MEKQPLRDLRNRNLRNIAFVTIVVILGLILLQSLFGNRSAADEIDYSLFRTYVMTGQVAQVTVKDGVATAVLVNGSTVTSRLPEDATSYQALLDEYQAQYNFALDYEPPSNSSFFTSMFISMLPILLLIGVWIYIMRRTQSGGGALSFGQSKAKLVKPDSTEVTFKDVAGIDEVTAEVEEIVDFLKDQRRFARLGAEIPKGVLLVGAPGTGKTLLAKAIAGEAKVPFFSISGSDFVEMFVGVGASRVRDMFEKAKLSAPCIIFIDEIDAVGRKRGAGLGGGHDEREQTLNQLLSEMDGFEPNKGIILLAATNRPDVLDTALLRPGRFDRRITVPYPTVRGRVEILRVHLRNKTVAEDVDPEVLARKTRGYTGADIRNLCNEAALLAARSDKEQIEMSDFEEATDRLSLGLKRPSMVPTEKERNMTAYHESGHALVGHVLRGDDFNVHKITILPRTAGTMGFVEPLEVEERYIHTESEFRNRIALALAGRAAEEVIFEEFGSGSSSDLRSATQMATEMVINLGMNKELGPISLGRERVDVFLGEELVRRNEHSEELSRLADNEIRGLLSEAYHKAKDILSQHRSALDELAGEVLEKEEISGPDLMMLLRRLVPAPAAG